MLQRIINLCIMICTVLFLSGCWDQEPLRDAHLAYSIAYDAISENRLMQTVELIKSSGGEQSSVLNEIHSATGHTARDKSDSLRKNVTGNTRYFKYNVQLTGKALEKKGIFPLLDVGLRDPGNPTAPVKLISVDGKASKVLEKKKAGNLLIGEFLKKKVRSLEDMSVFPNETLEGVFRKIADPGEDFTLPSIKVKGKEIIANGLALFHNDKLTGHLPLNQSVLFVLLSEEMGKNARITQKLSGKDSSKPANYVTIEVNKQKVKRKIKVTTDKKGNIHVNIKLQLRVIVVEYPRDHLHKAKERKKLNKQLSEQLTKESKKIIKTFQKAHCDAFGVGRHLIAYHPDLWKKKN